MATSELAPFARAGGLGDMVAGLASGLSRLNIDVRVLMPRYGWIDTTPMYRLPDPVGCDYRQREWWTAVYQASLPAEPRVRVYLLDRMDLYDRSGIYGGAGVSFPDNDVRFGVLSSAVFALSRALHWKPHIIHAHDWVTAPAAMLNACKEYLSGFSETHTVLSVHNLAHPGPTLQDSRGARPDRTTASEGTPEPSDRRAGGPGGVPGAFPTSDDAATPPPPASITALESGLRDADRIVFVSPSFAEEAQKPENRFGFDQLLRRRRKSVHGILNGIDYSRWDPSRDTHLVANFDTDSLERKKTVRRALLSEFAIAGDDVRPLFGMVTRLDRQKGFEELLAPEDGCLEALLRENRFYMVVVGTGDREYEARLAELAARYTNFAVAFRFDEALAHRVEAGSDFFLMPSRFEPCGLNQMYSLRYGTIPVVTATGGLKDTVRDIDSDASHGTGIVIPQASPAHVRQGIERALALWRSDPEVIQSVRRRGMQERFSIERMAGEYAQVYESLLDERRGPDPGDRSGPETVGPP